MLRKAGGERPAEFWKCDAIAEFGRSGGALVHPRGYLLGICCGGARGHGYYSHLHEVHRFLKDNGLRFLTE
jgi:hypothetical protein